MSAAATAPTRSVGRGGKSDILHHPITRNVLPFLNGGAAGMIATSFIQPVDMVKVCSIAFPPSFPLGFVGTRFGYLKSSWYCLGVSPTLLLAPCPNIRRSSP